MKVLSIKIIIVEIFNIETKCIFNVTAVTGDFGISKSAIETSDDDNEVYGIIPYVAPEVFQGQKYTKASDIYSFGMIMWELMTGRRPFWDRSHDTELIIEICDGLRPPIVTNAPKGYIELMQKCWHSDPHERPSANCIRNEFCYDGKLYPEKESKNPTKIINSPDIGPVTTNNAGAIFKSRPLSTMIKSANFTRSLRLKGQNAASGLDKRKFNNNLIENNNNDKDKIHKRLKYCEEQNDNYLT
ncbi:kinase-like domain-containing protein, partial [Rhizophagus irregularis DAOM 181602=DAOM 197198]